MADKKHKPHAGPAASIKWQSDVANRDYQSAENYLSLKLEPAAARKVVHRLKQAELTKRRATTFCVRLDCSRPHSTTREWCGT